MPTLFATLLCVSAALSPHSTAYGRGRGQLPRWKQQLDSPALSGVDTVRANNRGTDSRTTLRKAHAQRLLIPVPEQRPLGVADVYRIADLKHALADPSVTEARIRTDLQLSEQEWPASELITVPPGHSKLIVGADGLDPALWPVLDFAFLPRRLQLSTNCKLTLSRLWVLRFSLLYVPIYPGMDLLHPVQPPHASIVFQGVRVIFLTGPVWDPVYSVAGLEGLQAKRPAAFPGVQIAEPAILTPVCRAASVRYASFCWDGAAATPWVDIVQEAVDVSSVPAKPAGYYLAMKDVLALITYPYNTSCIVEQGIENCFSVQYAAHRGKPFIPPRQPSAKSDNKLLIILLATILGGGVLFLVAGAALAVMWRRKSMSKQLRELSLPVAKNPFAKCSSCTAKSLKEGFSYPGAYSFAQDFSSVRTDLRLGVDVLLDEAPILGLGMSGRVVAGTYDGQQVAVKLLHHALFQPQPAPPSSRDAPSSATGPLPLELLREVELLLRCQHPNVVKLLGVGSAGNNMPFIVMERLPLTLRQRMYGTDDNHTNHHGDGGGDGDGGGKGSTGVGTSGGCAAGAGNITRAGAAVAVAGAGTEAAGAGAGGDSAGADGGCSAAGSCGGSGVQGRRHDERHHHADLLPLEEVMHIALGIASGLAYLHPDTIHRDLKPDNILLSNEGASVVKLADFGSARHVLSTLVTDLGGAGTAQYMAPECFQNMRGVLTPASDVYSFGVILAEMLNGRRLWPGMSPLMIAVAVTHYGERPPLPRDPQRCPPALRKLVKACWDADPGLRPSAAAVAKKLAIMIKHIQQGRPTPELGQQAHLPNTGSGSDDTEAMMAALTVPRMAPAAAGAAAVLSPAAAAFGLPYEPNWGAMRERLKASLAQPDSFMREGLQEGIARARSFVVPRRNHRFMDA